MSIFPEKRYAGRLFFVNLQAMKRATFIVNPISGTQRKEKFPEFVEATLDKGQFASEVVFTERAGHATEIARKCVEQGVDVVAAVGGDGTINEVARALVHTDTALALVPCGSGNGLARHLGIPLDARRDIEIINHCQIESLDYGVINDIPFFCTCGMGFDAFISLKFAEAGKRGALTYVENVLKEGLKYKPQTYLVEDETGKRRYKAFLIACANASQYGNNAYIAPKASMSDGLMDVTILEPFDVLDAPAIGLDLMNKALDKNSKIKTFRCQRLHVTRQEPGAIHFDGDPVMTGTEIDVHMESRGIRMVVNPSEVEPQHEPNIVIDAFSEVFEGINSVRRDLEKSRRRLTALNRVLLRKLNR